MQTNSIVSPATLGRENGMESTAEVSRELLANKARDSRECMGRGFGNSGNLVVRGCWMLWVGDVWQSINHARNTLKVHLRVYTNHSHTPPEMKR